jgi:hypothetical protein
MSSGKITVTNNTDNAIWITICENNNSNVMLASGTLTSKQSYDYVVSGYPAYQVNFFPPPNGTINAPNVPANGAVVFAVNSDRIKLADE